MPCGNSSRRARLGFGGCMSKALGRAWARGLSAGALGVAGAALIVSPRFLPALALPSQWACLAVLGVGLSFTGLIASYLFQTTQCVKSILLPAVVQPGPVRAMLMRGRIAVLVSLAVGALLALSLLVAVVTASGWFLAGSFLIALVLGVGVGRIKRSPASAMLTRRARWLLWRAVLTALVVAALVVLQLLVYRFDPAYEGYGSLDQPEEYVISTVQHDCRLLQHLARTLAYIEVVVWGLRRIEGFGGVLFASTFLMMFSLVPLLAWTLAVRSVIELPLGLARYPGGDEKR